MTIDTSRHPIAEWALTLLILLFGTTHILQAYAIPSGSMEGTLRPGDLVLVDKVTYAPAGAASSKLLPHSEVKRGDIVVFRYPGDISKNYVKRCVALPGDRVALRKGRLFVNGREVEEPYARRDAADFAETAVPEGSYFTLGDNRGNSADSRYWGFVPRSHIVGRPLLVVWSYEPFEGREANPVDALPGIFTRTRWERIATFPR